MWRGRSCAPLGQLNIFVGCMKRRNNRRFPQRMDDILSSWAEATLTTALRIDCGKTRGTRRRPAGKWVQEEVSGVVRAGLLEVVRVLVHCDVFSEPGNVGWEKRRIKVPEVLVWGVRVWSLYQHAEDCIGEGDKNNQFNLGHINTYEVAICRYVLNNEI